MGTLTNTVGVLSAIYFLYGQRFVLALGQDVDMAKKVIIGIGITNGIPEVIVAIILATNIVKVLRNRNK